MRSFLITLCLFPTFLLAETSLKEQETKEKELIKREVDSLRTIPVEPFYEIKNRVVFSGVYYNSHETFGNSGPDKRKKMGLGFSYLRKQSFQLDSVKINTGFSIFPNNGVYFDATLDSEDEVFTMGWKIGLTNRDRQICYSSCFTDKDTVLDFGLQGGYRFHDKMFLYGQTTFSDSYAIGLGFDF